MHILVERSPDLGLRELPEIKPAGRFQILMSQNLFYVPDGATALQKIRCRSMPQDMRRNSFPQALEQRCICTPKHRLRV